MLQKYNLDTKLVWYWWWTNTWTHNQWKTSNVWETQSRLDQYYCFSLHVLGWPKSALRLEQTFWLTQISVVNKEWSESVSYSVISDSVIPWTVAHQAPCRCRRHRFELGIRKIPWRRKQLPTPVFHLGNSCLVGYSLWSHKRIRHNSVITQQQAPEATWLSEET